MALTMAEVARDYETDGVPSSGSHKIKKGDLRNWGAWVEGLISAFTANGGLIFSSKAALDASLAYAANTMAWVIGDATVANNGVYQKQGASGAGSWTRVSDLPFSFIIASDVGAGTANAIQATTSIPVSGSALVWLNVFEANTASPVTVSFNGGTALTIKTNAGNDVAAGGLVAGMIVLGIVSGSTFRLVSDQASAAIIAQVEAILDEFQTIYLGAFAVAPTLDLEGNPLIVGAQYFNTVSDTLFTWNGTAWITNADLTVDVPANLTGSVQAPAITKGNQYRWSIFAFNGGETERAKGSGHATADFRSVIEAALGTGEKVDFPAWVYPIRSATAADRVISITGDFPIDVECAKGARFLLGATIDDLTAGVFSLQASTMPSMTSRIGLRWEGGIFDASELVDTPVSGLNILDIYQYTGYSIRNAQFYAGISAPSGTAIGMGKCDTAIVTHNCFGGVIDNCDFIGFYDVGIYASGNNITTYDGIGEAEVFQSNRFRRCLNGINMKRDQQGHHMLNNWFFECQNGILASPADASLTNQGETSIIIGNRFKKIQGRPIFLETGKDYQVKDNTIVDFGKLISDGTTFTTVSAGNRIAGIDGRDISFALIEGNDIRMDDWAGGTAGANVEPVGVQLLIGDGAVGSFDNIVRNNYIYKVHRTMLEGASCGRNKFITNDTVAPTSGTALAHSIAGTNSTFIGQMLEGSLTSDLASLADGAGTDVTVTVTGAVLGDWVDSVSFSRDISGLLYSANVTAANTVEIRIQNETGGAVDLANTVFKVRVRPA